MKKILLLLCVCHALTTSSQVVLNEVYPQPGNGYHEFFELYNHDSVSTGENLDNYTVVVYYEESGGKTGFYVLDMPNQVIPAKGYFVTASASPFNIQGQLGITANANWNALGPGGSLTKWERNGSSYTSVAVPADLNDLLVRIVGAGGVYHVFVYKNGILGSGIIGGTNSMVIPAYIKTMPELFVDMSGSSPDFTIKFNAIANNSVEYISSSVGTNNGYFRSYDGKCGQWLKSDSPGQHTPGVSNGTIPAGVGQVSIAAVITLYAGDPDKSLLSYNVSAWPQVAFPLTIEVYKDMGIEGEYDVSDSLIDSRNINSIAESSQDIILPSDDIAVILVVKSADDCYNNIFALQSYLSTLRVNLISFTGNLNSNTIHLNWSVSENKSANRFEIQRSANGREFNTLAVITASGASDLENYSYHDPVSKFEKIFYRLRITDINNKTDYSRNLVFQSGYKAEPGIRILGNPVKDKITFSFTSAVSEMLSLRIADASGRLIMSRKINSTDGQNLVSLSLNSISKTGLYVLELSNGKEIKTAKFLKQ